VCLLSCAQQNKPGCLGCWFNCFFYYYLFFLVFYPASDVSLISAISHSPAQALLIQPSTKNRLIKAAPGEAIFIPHNAQGMSRYNFLFSFLFY